MSGLTKRPLSLLWATVLLGLLMASTADASSMSGGMPQRLEYDSYHTVCVQVPALPLAPSQHPVHALIPQFTAAARLQELNRHSACLLSAPCTICCTLPATTML
jgi:hypothetical protein